MTRSNFSMRMRIDMYHDDIVAEYYRRAKAGMNADKRRAGIFHVSDYAMPCARQAYLRHTSVQQIPPLRDNIRALIKGEAEHQLLDRGARSLDEPGEHPVALDLEKNANVSYAADDPPLPNDQDIDAWINQVIGEYDAIYKIGYEQKILIDYKTKLEFNPRQVDPDAEHVAQLNIYNYIISRMNDTEALAWASVVYIVTGTNDKTHIHPRTFALEDIENVRARMLERLQQFRECHDTGKLPPRVLPIGHYNGYGHPSCVYCPYRDKCMTRQPGGLHVPNDWDQLSELDRELNIL